MRGRESPGVDRTAADVQSFILSKENPEMHCRESGCHQGPGLTAAIEVSVNIPRTQTRNDP